MKPSTISSVFSSNFFKIDDTQVLLYTTKMNDICSYLVENFHYLFDIQKNNNSFVELDDIKNQILTLKSEFNIINNSFEQILKEKELKINSLNFNISNFENDYRDVINFKKLYITSLNQKVLSLNQLINKN
jgi:hypothetical protein